MKRIVIVLALLSLPLMRMAAAVDENFHVYLCFGQSNMEGNAQWETVDNQFVDPRFQMLATCNFTDPQRTLGEWYTAYCPIVSPTGKLGPTDYFGRTMVAAMPAEVKVGVIAVAMGGSPIEMFDKDKYQQKLEDNPDQWWAQLANMYYGGNPYGRIIEMAKKAQEVGVIKGILLHQGCSNCGDPNWPNMVKKIYNDMLTDLGLQAADVPLFVGEVEQADMGGGCAGHNAVVAQIPNVIPTGHVVSSVGLPGNGVDPWHFSAAGYRTFGKRYAYEALKVMGKTTQKDAAYTLPDNLTNFYTLNQLEDVQDITIRVGGSKQVNIWGTFADGHRENLTAEVTLTSQDFTISGNTIMATAEKQGTVTATYTDFTGQQFSLTINVTANDMGPNHVLVVENGNAGSNLWDKQLHCALVTPMVKGNTYVVKALVRSDNGGDCALWPIWKASPNRDQWGNSADVQYLAAYNTTSSFQELTWEFQASYDHDCLQFVFGLIGGKIYFDEVTCVEKGSTTDMIANGNFESDDLTTWTILSYTGQSIYIGEDETSGIAEMEITDERQKSGAMYSLYGIKVGPDYRGIAIKNGKKIVIK